MSQDDPNGGTNRINAVLFDLDNTLYENDEELEAWARESIEQVLEPSQSERLIRVLPQILDFLEPADGVERLTVTKVEYSDMLNRLMPGLSGQAMDFLSGMNASWINDMRLTPDAAELLSALDKAAIPYGIVTNAPAFQQIKIGRLGLNGRAKCIFISGIFGVDKPDPKIFLAAARALGTPCESILFVGDSPDHDMVGARGAGMKSAWLRHGRTWPTELAGQEPDFIVDSLIDLSPLIIEECGISHKDTKPQRVYKRLD